MAKNKILVPIDFSDQSLIALGQSYNLAREYNAEITLLYVVEDNGFVSRFFSKQQDDEVKKNIQENLDKIVKDVEKQTGLRVSTMIARGTVYEKVVEVADMINAVFIIMGTTGSGSIKSRFIGSNALRIVRSSDVPVITIKGKEHRNGCKNIILPLDLTKETREKVNFTVELAKLNNATVHLITVLFTSDEFVVNRLTRQLQQAKTFVEGAGIKCEAEIIKTVTGEKSVAEAIVDYAHKKDGDLVVIMTQQEVNFTQMFIGSSAQEVINKSDVPVLSIIPSMKRKVVFTPY